MIIIRACSVGNPEFAKLGEGGDEKNKLAWPKVPVFSIADN